MAKPERGLGRGLDALFGGSGEVSILKGDAEKQSLPIDKIVPNQNQPRKYFQPQALEELASSIAKEGVLQPLLVRPLPDGNYQIVAGERRWRASRLANLRTLPVIIKEMSDEQALAIALIENLQREDLNPMEEALGYKDLRDSFGLSQEEIATRVGKSRPAVSNTLRLLQLPLPLQEDIAVGRVTQGHARPLLAVDDEAAALTMREAILTLSPTVREVEAWVNNWKASGILPGSGEASHSEPSRSPSRSRVKTSPELAEMEANLSDLLALKVSLHGNLQKGRMQIDFSNEQELKGLLQRLGL